MRLHRAGLCDVETPPLEDFERPAADAAGVDDVADVDACAVEQTSKNLTTGRVRWSFGQSVNGCAGLTLPDDQVS